ncbi:unnamed protein product [Blepharisma stoltei]|uniref:Protein kinase domain-containing protein n=1 Tax=Blepharisma stoltei TaxID=1481888 RepID=A0AAU9IUW0_9CILI|nr:unnamed protein product [Blepharisma stoltei]
MSPEMFKHLIDGTEPIGYSYEIDWWALGILTYELLKSSPPFGLYGEDLFAHILRGLDYVDMAEIPEIACDFIRKLLNPDSSQRLGHNSSNEVLDHQFLRTSPPLIVPNSTQLQVIQSWCEFIDPSETVSEPNLFIEF